MISNGNYSLNIILQVILCCSVGLLSATQATAQVLKVDKRDHQLKLELKSDWLPTIGQIYHLESLLRMPIKIGRLQEYQRYWIGTHDKGRKRIYGYLTRGALPPDTMPSAIIVKYMMVEPTWDGGCRTVDIYYDVEKDLVLSHVCGSDLSGPAGPAGWREK